jgi:hypothetical protein
MTGSLAPNYAAPRRAIAHLRMSVVAATVKAWMKKVASC